MNTIKEMQKLQSMVKLVREEKERKK